MLLKAGVEIFKLLGRLGIKPKDVIGMGGDIVKMGKSLFNTRVNPKLLEYIAKNQKIPTKILENIKIHARTLKNATENQKNLFLENIKSISKAKTPVKLKEAEIIKFPVKSKSPVSSGQTQATGIKQLESKAKVLEEFKFSYPKHANRLKGDETVEQIKEIMFRLDTEGIPFQHGGIAPLFSKRQGYDNGEFVEKTPFVTQEDYDKARYEDPKGEFAMERWGESPANPHEVSQTPQAEAYGDEIISYMGDFVEGEPEKNLSKAKVIAHEKLHLLWEDPEVRETAPPWVQEQFRKADALWEKYIETGDEAYYDAFNEISSGIALDPDNPARGGDVMGEELYTRYLENKYFPKTESDKGPWGDRIYFDKILKEHWDPYAEKFDTLMRSRKAHGGIANHFRVR